MVDRELGARAPITVVGLMSGTSLDGISAAVARFATADDGTERAELLHFATTAYTGPQRARLLAAMTGGSAAEYCRLHADLGDWLGEAAAAALDASGVRDAAAVASHGHTIWHEPGHSTWQIGDASRIAERTGLPVVGDFRARDVAAGGQGAPLVPAADAALFADARAWRALQNLGGIGNVTLVPPAHGSGTVRAFDTGPGVAVIDAVARRVAPHLPYDVDGALAMAGRPIDAVVSALLAAPYFSAPPPKSTGRELFSAAYVEEFVAKCYEQRPEATGPDLVASAVALTARAVADAYDRFVHEPIGDVLLSGGGARNPALVAALERHLAPRRVRQFGDLFFDGEAKEAVAFAYLGALHLQGRPGNVPSATGARGPRVLGMLTPA